MYYPQTGDTMQNSTATAHYYGNGGMDGNATAGVRTPPLHGPPAPASLDGTGAPHQIINESNGLCYTQLVEPEYVNGTTTGPGYRGVMAVVPPQTGGPPLHHHHHHLADYGSGGGGGVVAAVSATSPGLDTYHHRPHLHPHHHHHPRELDYVDINMTPGVGGAGGYYDGCSVIVPRNNKSVVNNNSVTTTSTGYEEHGAVTMCVPAGAAGHGGPSPHISPTPPIIAPPPNSCAVVSTSPVYQWMRVKRNLPKPGQYLI